ncbi:LysM peptidoglycan-binding domain-containing protein [Hymenobacter lucidus]|uniref:LysM peptidoglycan-binding domain-containing protein n=1 Tax=Hymenobacter lucidus TaxID=2880930 RepID=A0ABS8APL0_9BACT|nr:LysM peptidoglycan-binding domain-containing protein [Hymenobacter lucidus]MCB2407364.1 LysM peptidoglycan-binding domain-containing protein [Hymenobacter lucidus]
MRPFFRVFLFTGLLSAPVAAQAQQPAPVAALSEDSVRVMSGLVQTSVRQLRQIYFEPSDARAVQLIETALQEIPTLNQRLSHYTASLPREQQQVLAQRLRQQPWQIELQTLMRSPQFKGFDARAAKNPDLKAAAERLHASGFVGTAKPAPPVAAAPAPEPMGTISLPPAAKSAVRPASAGNALAASKPAPAAKSPATFKVAPLSTAAKPVAPAATAAPVATTAPSSAATRHTVQKGETLFSISRQYGVTPAQLQSWNKKADGGVKIGEVLVVETSK